MRVLEQEQVVVGRAGVQRALERVGVGVRDAPEPPDTQRAGTVVASVATQSSSDAQSCVSSTLLEAAEERGRVGAVERAVVPRERQDPDVAHRDHVVAVGTGHDAGRL